MENYSWRLALEQFKHLPLDQSGYVVDENTFSDKNIVYNLLETRATEIGIALIQNMDISEGMTQTLSAVDVVEVDRSDFPCAPTSGCYWLKTKVAVPKFIKMNSVTGIVSNSENPRFTFIKWDRFQYIPQARTAAMANARYWTVREVPNEGQYIYLYNDRFLQTIAMTGIWENPMEVEAYPVCGVVNLKAKCNPLEVGFYTDPWMRDIIMSKTWAKLLPVRASANDDRVNNDKSPDLRAR